MRQRGYYQNRSMSPAKKPDFLINQELEDSQNKRNIAKTPVSKPKN
jgi:hypothetical protein